jgi:EmrB/QacA subfamily drug resistance transporter
MAMRIPFFTRRVSDRSIYLRSQEADMTLSPSKPRAGWTFAIVSVALFMVTLDNLVVSTALPTIRVDLGASLESLEWTVNAYTLAFAVLLLTGAALGDRFGRRRMFGLGIGLFTLSSAAAALAPSTDALVAARALQGVGAAIVLPLTLTLLSEAVSIEKRGLALGAWSGISGLGVALGPVVGGAVVDGISWHWIFWLNVPIGLALVPLSARFLSESRGPANRLDLPGIGLAGLGLLGVVYGIVRGEALGWTSATIVGAIAAGLALLVAFVVWEHRAPSPMLPLRFFRSRAFSATNGTSLAMFFGVFGSIFLLSQFFQTTQGLSPLEAGLRVLPWTIMPMFVAPVAGLLSDRIGARPLMAGGLALQAIAIGWLSAVITPDVAYGSLILPFVLAGTGMALVFAPAANAVLASVRPEEAGQASGATNAIRELGGVLGVAVLASVFTAHGGYGSPQAYVDGMTAALPIGAAVLGVGAVLALLIPGKARAVEPASAPAAALAGDAL